MGINCRNNVYSAKVIEWLRSLDDLCLSFILMQIFEVLLVTFILLLCVNSQQGVQSTIEPFISIAFVHKKEYNIM